MNFLALFASIAVSLTDPHYFADETGKTWIPIGCNICFERTQQSSAEARRLFDSWLTPFAANGGNFVRVWLSTPFVDVMPTKAYEFSEEATENLKWLVRRAEQLNLKLKFTFENFRRLGEPTDANPDKGIISFRKPVYAPYAKTMQDVFTDPKCFDIYLAKARHVAEAVGKSDALIAVELWNEITSTRVDPDVLKVWSERMLVELKKLYPGKMTLQNLGSYSGCDAWLIYRWLGQHRNSDFMQAHRYLDLHGDIDCCRGPMDVLCADVVRELRELRPDVPAILAETGAVERGHAGPSHLYQHDTAGILIHDEIFAAFFAGSAGCGQPWHWDHQYIALHNHWRHFRLFAKAIGGLDPAAEHFRPHRTESYRLRYWMLVGEKTTTAWLRDKRNTWASELDCKRPPETVTGEVLPFPRRARKYTWYLPWEDRTIVTDSPKVPPFKRSAVVRFATDF